MTTYWYRIEAPREEEALYVRYVLRAHGLLYPWALQTTRGRERRKVIRILVGKTVSKMEAKEIEILPPLAELVLSTDAVVLRKLGLSVRPEAVCGGVGYVFAAEARTIAPEVALPLPVSCLRGLDVTASGWTNRYLLMEAERQISPVAVSRSNSGTRLTVFALDFVGLMDTAILGPREDSAGMPDVFEDWAEAYGTTLTQNLARTPIIDYSICMIRALLFDICSGAFPVEVDYYPDGKTAPLLITGDTDDATAGQLETYFQKLESHGARGTVIIKAFRAYSEEALLSARIEGHAFGIHPYGRTATVKAYQRSFRELLGQYRQLFQDAPCAIRNHRFQWVGRTGCLGPAIRGGVYFDMNCVAANGQNWLGSGSGVAFPIPFPPIGGRFSPHPLHLPTIIEDDVLLHDLEYCYRPFENGDSFSVDAAISFLDDWVLKERWPAAVNFHPEHTTLTIRQLIDSVLSWAERKGVWMPSLIEFGGWLKSRDECEIQVIEGSTGSQVLVIAPVSVALRFYYRGTRSMECTPARAGTSWWHMTAHNTKADSAAFREVANEVPYD